jgi:hypothetical protein
VALILLPGWGLAAGGGAYLDGPALVAESFSSGSVGNTYQGKTRWTYSDTRARTGTKSGRIQLSLGQPPGTCGGAHEFGGRLTLPTLIPEGYNVWYRAYFYLPSTMPMGYCFSGSDDADAATCGKSADGPGHTKWMVMAPDTGTARLYMNLRMPRRAMGLNNGYHLISEAQQTEGDYINTTLVIPRDEWFCLQVHIYLSSVTNGGFIRGWMNDTYLGQHSKKTLANSAYKLKEWGIGSYWNGVPWTDGDVSRTDMFWVDDMIVATDYPGYGAPTTQDSGGRYFIHPDATAEDVG